MLLLSYIQKTGSPFVDDRNPKVYWELVKNRNEEMKMENGIQRKWETGDEKNGHFPS